MRLIDFVKVGPIKLIGDVTERTFKIFCDDLENYTWTRNEQKTIPILLHTYGGNAETTLQIMSLLKDYKRRGFNVITFASGQCMSAGFCIFMMGNERYADRNVNFMHHKIRTSFYGGTDQDADFEKKEMQRLDKQIDKLMCVKMTKGEEDKYNSGGEVYWRYTEAKKRGIIT